MTDAVLVPAFVLRSYLWAVLKANDPATWDEAKYGGKTPIVPLSEEPDIEAYSGPHIVYGFAHSPTGSLPANRGGSISFAVYDSNFRRLSKTMNIIENAFGRLDESARDINNYTSMKPEFNGIRFGHTRISYMEGGTPETEEGGRQSSLISVSFDYFVDYDVITNV